MRSRSSLVDILGEDITLQVEWQGESEWRIRQAELFYLPHNALLRRAHSQIIWLRGLCVI